MKKHVLLIEDYYSNAEMIDILLEAGFEVSLLNSSSKFLDSVSLIKPNLVILDIKLSDVNGYNLLNMLSTELITTAIPIIVISSLQESSFTDIPCNVKAFIINPLDFDLVRDKALEITC